MAGMDPTIVLAGFVGLLATAAKVIDFLRYLVDWQVSRGKAITQALAWLGGIAVVFLYAASDFGDTVDLGGILLSDVNGSTKVIVGVAIGSLASLAKDFAARDRDTVPPLLK